ncbi:dirigent protein 22-like [Aristolochia californica]|uniref:dirigent protein 22-like n=1 Tax=Aristolochia californica TaxID=171875 RepID=UPI0035D78DDA
MAKGVSLLLFFTLSILFFSFIAEGKSDSPQPHPVFGYRQEKLSHLRFYFHDLFGGRNPTAVTIIPPVSNDTSRILGFGAVSMIDDPLTQGPEITSKPVGRAQGFFAAASLSENDVGLLMSMTFVFTSGKHNGSTLSILGRNALSSEAREMPVVGGSGLFRWARGYVQMRTYSVSATMTDSVVEYNVYVLHY